MRAMLCGVAIVLGSGVARAQPGRTAAGVPPPYAYQPQVVLTDDERDLLAKGEISDPRYMGGALASIFVGFGIGQAIDGRWSDTGYIFTLGEGVSMAAMLYGFNHVVSCTGCNRGDDGSTWVIAGFLTYSALHVWEIADALIAPPRHNRRVRELRSRLGYPPPGVYYGLTPILTPPKNGDGAVAGFELRF